MKALNWALRVLVAGACVLAARRASAQLDCSTITRANIVRCAASGSLSSAAAERTLESIEGRRRAARVLLPSNPTIGLGASYPAAPGPKEFLWSATLTQEFEIAGQRGARLDVVNGEEKAQRARLAATRREAVAEALRRYFDVLAASAEVQFTEYLAQLARSLTTVATARAQAGVAAGVEGDLARSAATRFLQSRLAAREKLAVAGASLATAVGLPPDAVAPKVEGDLSPLETPNLLTPPILETALTTRPEVSIARADAAMQTARASLYRRLRIPNPSVSLYARNDWVGERIVGLSVGVPVPLPGPIGRTYVGEIAEAESLADRASTEVELQRRLVRLELTNAFTALTSRQSQSELFDSVQVTSTETSLRNLATELESGRLPVRDALITQQALVDYLLANIEARRQVCIASVELVRIAGLSFERGGK